MRGAVSRGAGPGPRRGGGAGARCIPPTKPTSGLQDGCTQLVKANLRVLPARRTPWAGLLPLAPLADPVSRGQTQESVPAPSPATSWTGGRQATTNLPSLQGQWSPGCQPSRTQGQEPCLEGTGQPWAARTTLETEKQEAWPTPRYTYPKYLVQGPQFLSALLQGPARAM